MRTVSDLWDNIKCTNIQIIEVPEKEEKKKRHEKNFKEIIVENFPNVEKEIVKSKKHKESHEGYTQGETGQDTY